MKGCERLLLLLHLTVPAAHGGADAGPGDPDFRSGIHSEYRVSSPLSFIGGVHIGARALHVLNLIWFG